MSSTVRRLQEGRRAQEREHMKKQRVSFWKENGWREAMTVRVYEKAAETKMHKTGGLDIFRMAAAFLVVAIHTSPLTDFCPEADFFLTRILARIAVPFFLMVTGQFVLGEHLGNGNRKEKAQETGIAKSIRKLALLYLFSMLLYLPLGIYAGHYRELNPGRVLRMLFFDGTFYHLWYFPACITGLFLVWLGGNYLSEKALLAVGIVLYTVGLFGDSYYGLLAFLPGVRSLYDTSFEVFSYTRNGIFYAPVFLIMGGIWGGEMRRKERGKALKPQFYALGFAVSFLLMTMEGFVLRYFALQRHDSMYLFLLPCMYFLYRFISCWQLRPSGKCRKLSMWIFILHPAIIVAVRGAAEILDGTLEALFGGEFPFDWILVENSLGHYLAVSAASFVCAAIFAGLERRFEGVQAAAAGRGRLSRGRAWIELDREALAHNVRVLQAELSRGSRLMPNRLMPNRLMPNRLMPNRLMPVVKADAYGHGAALVAGELNRLGIRDFCVASAREGAELRRAGIRGNILILGYTSQEDFPLLQKYHLLQTVADYEHALLMEEAGSRKSKKSVFRVHLALDTGMHRLGISSDDFEKIQEIFSMKHLRVEGIFTHLCAADGTGEREKAYTELQAKRFYEVTDRLEKEGGYTPEIHLSSSYGLLNYPWLTGDYVRAGIALYGVWSTGEDMERSRLSLKPVLSLKARVASVRTLRSGEGAGYGLCFAAEKEMKVAVIAIGYADGLPRELSCGKGEVLIRGSRAKIAGRICMDQTLVDVTHIPKVQAGDIAVVIGSCGRESISVCDIAGKTETIANEILSRLGKRLERGFV